MMDRSAWHGYLWLVPTKPHVLEVGKALIKIGEQLPGRSDAHF